MKAAHRGIVVAALHCGIVLSLAGKYALDRERLPRAWARTTPIDPNLPIRGRYVRLSPEVEFTPPSKDWVSAEVRLGVRDGRLTATETVDTGVYRGGAMLWRQGNRWALMQPVLFFIPEHAPDPSRRAPGEELWVEVSVPANGPPRPLRLGVKKDGVLKPLDPGL